MDLLSEQSSLSHPAMFDIWRDICVNCDIGIGTLTALAASKLPGQHQRMRRMLAERVLRITVKPFMDINTMIEERLIQRSEEHTSELQSRGHLVCRLLLEKKNCKTERTT